MTFINLWADAKERDLAKRSIYESLGVSDIQLWIEEACSRRGDGCPAILILALVPAVFVQAYNEVELRRIRADDVRAAAMAPKVGAPRTCFGELMRSSIRRF